jgi:hypothetical protein
MKKFIILIPVYNDWKSVFKLLENIDIQVSKFGADVSILIINDASTNQRPILNLDLKNIKSIKVINMKENRGHARCNASGLKFLAEKVDFDHVILMDGDGEDRPEELFLLFSKSKEYPAKVITADRIKRSEGLVFKFLYQFHKTLTYIFTGKIIKFGNYSCLPKDAVIRLVKEPSLWSSYSGSLAKTVKNRFSIASIRGQRYFGPSQMNFFSLLIHSFSIIAVFKKTVMARSFLFLTIYLFLFFKNISIFTAFPFLAVVIFLFFIFKVSFRENIEELNNSLNNINSIDTLNDSNGR